MAPTDRTAFTQGLRAVADLIDAHPDLPQPYINAYSQGGVVEAHWYLHIWADDLTEQKATAAAIVSTIGGHWDKNERTYDDGLEFTQTRDGLSLEVVVNRAAVCERVVVGTHEVTVPATPKIPARPATGERVETVEDVQWVCSSLLAEPVPA
jgi:hypothetical protein